MPKVVVVKLNAIQINDAFQIGLRIPRIDGHVVRGIKAQQHLAETQGNPSSSRRSLHRLPETHVVGASGRSEGGRRPCGLSKKCVFEDRRHVSKALYILRAN